MGRASSAGPGSSSSSVSVEESDEEPELAEWSVTSSSKRFWHLRHTSRGPKMEASLMSASSETGA